MRSAEWRRDRRPRSEEGAATLALVALLLFGMALVALHGVRAHVNEQRLAGHEGQARALQAGAQSGLEAALALAAAIVEESPPAFDAAGWAALPGPAATLPDGTGFETRLRNHGLLPFDFSLIEVESRAYDRTGGTRVIRQQARMRPWLAHAPPAPLVVGREADLPGGLSLVNDDGGILAWTGGGFSAPAAELELAGPPSCPPQGICESDARLAELPPDRFCGNFLARSPDLLRALALRDEPGSGVILIRDDSGTVSLGDALHGAEENPAFVFIDGDLRVDGDALVQGIVYVHGDWLPGSGRLEVHGAMIVAGRALHAGPARLIYGEAPMSRLTRLGPYARIPGTWADF